MKIRVSSDGFRKRDHLLIYNLSTAQLVDLGIPDFAWGDTLHDFYKVGTVTDKNPAVFTKQGHFSPRFIEREQKQVGKVWLFDYTNKEGARKRVFIEKREERE